MTAALTHGLLHFMKWFSVAALIAGACYGVIFWMRSVAAGCASVLAFIASLLGFGMMLSVLPLPIGLLLTWWFALVVAVVLLVCIGGAFAERLSGIIQSSFFGRVVALFAAFLMGVIISLCLAIFSSFFVSLRDGWGEAGLYVGLLVTPSAIPTFIWLWRSSQTRPGVERHLTLEEQTGQSL